MQSNVKDVAVTVFKRSYFSINFRTGVDHPKGWYSQQIDLGGEPRLQEKSLEDIFPVLPGNVIDRTEYIATPEIKARRIYFGKYIPLFRYFEQQPTDAEIGTVIIAILDYLQSLEDKRSQNTLLTPFNLLYSPENKEVQYIALHCNVPKGQVRSSWYRAPELLGRLRTIHSLSADFYSLGIMLYEYFNGGHPFSGLSKKHALRQQVVANLKALHKVKEGFPEALSLIIKKLLAKQRDKRYLTCYGIRKDIEDFYLGKLNDDEKFVPGLFDFDKHRFVTFPQTYVNEKKKLLDHLLFETEERLHRIIFIAGSQLNNSDQFIRKYLSQHGKRNVLIASAHIKENAKYLPFYTASLVFKEIASWLKHSKLYRDERFKQFSEQTDSIIIETLIHICPELELLKSDKFKPVGVPISDTNILYTSVKHLFRFLGSVTKPLIISLNNTEYIDKDSTKLFFEILSTADIPNLAFLFQSFGSPKKPKLFSNRNAKFTSLEMRHIEHHYIVAMLKDFTNGKLKDCDELARLLQDRCLGKYELIRQFLSEMQENGSFRYDRNLCMWVWDKEAADSIASPLTLGEITVHKQKLLPQITVEILQQAALIGNVFNLQLLSELTKFSKEQLFLKLIPAVKHNLVFELTQYSNFKTPENSIFFKFASDRGFRAFFIQGSYKYKDKFIQSFSLTVEYLLKRGNNKLLFEDFFASIPKFASELDDDTRGRIIQIMIGKIKDYIFLGKLVKAKKLLELCYELLPEHSWLHKYYLTKDLYYTAFVLAHHTHTFEEVDRIFQLVDIYLTAPDDHIAFNMIYIESKTRRNEFERAKEILRSSTKLVDKDLLEVVDFKQSVQNKVFGLLFRNRVLNDELKQSQHRRLTPEERVLAQINLIAHKMDRDVYYATLNRIIRKVFLDGLYDEFALPLLIYSKRLLDARKYISFALKLSYYVANNVSDKYMHADKCRLYYYSNIHPFSERIQSSKQKIKNAIDQKVNLGDLTSAYDLSFDYIFRSLVEGEKLQNLLNDTQKIWRIKRMYSKRQLDFDLLTVFHDRIKALYDHQRFTDVTRDSEKFERQAKLSFWNNLTLLIYFYNTDHFDAALICAGNAQLRSDTVENNLPLIMLEFYYCLSLAEDFKNLSNFRKLESLRYIGMRYNELKKLSHHSKENFQHMALLLKGTMYRLSKRPKRAIPTIKKAAYTAEKYGNINIQALCYKILAQVALEQNRTIDRRQYLVKAYNYYKKWGANTIAERIKLDNFEVFEEMNLRIFNVI